MSDTPRISGKQAVKAFKKAGFEIARKSGSHVIMKKDGHPQRLSIPVHGSKIIGEGLLKSQILAAGLTVEQFRELL